MGNIGLRVAMRAALVDEAAREFHVHLDRCGQCRDHPMELCAEGGRLLLNTGRAMGLGPGIDAHLRAMGLDPQTGKPHRPDGEGGGQ